MDFEKELKDRTDRVDRLLEKHLPKEDGPQKTVLEAMRYSVMSGGKRLRPILMDETYTLFNGSTGSVEPFMAAIEMIHSYSLVHDDLPALDNDEYRRGRKSTHAAYGEAMGILAGDALLNYAFETAALAFDIDPGPCVAKAFSLFAKKTGIYGMIGGQVVDVETEGRQIGPDTLRFIHEKKTGALIEAAMMTGAILAGASDDQVDNVGSIALDVGLAFQIRDDILDVTSTTEVLGKPVGSDEKNNKNTYVKYFGLDKAESEVEHISERALTSLASLPYENPFLTELIKRLVHRKK
ncbi:MAG: polyprenyl synthetase family protein [Lachnospiraceae bacterium]|nr:polyprenyl synthetase family protein [Lachnospiraceae bacterium]